MSYIKTLQEELQKEKERVKEYEKGMHDLSRYLNLPKFHENPYVNKQDIFNRLADTWQNVACID